MTNLLEAWNAATLYCDSYNKSCTGREKRILLAHVCGIPPSQLDLFFDTNMEDKACQEFFRLVSLRSKGVPIQYLLQEWEFLSLPVKMKKGVFIPRRDTEVWVEAAIDRVKKEGKGRSLRILDMACGSGAIAVACAANIPSSIVYGVDICLQAIHIARKNALLNKVGDRTHFLVSDLFKEVEKQRLEKFDIMLVNPPYLSVGEWDKLSLDVKDYEPRRALVGGEEGMELIEEILTQAHRFLAEDALLFLEHSPWQSSPVRAIAQKVGTLEFKRNIPDYCGKIRATEWRVIRRQG